MSDEGKQQFTVETYFRSKAFSKVIAVMCNNRKDRPIVHSIIHKISSQRSSSIGFVPSNILHSVYSPMSINWNFFYTAAAFCLKCTINRKFHSNTLNIHAKTH